MRALIITYYWPPSSGSGVQRWMYFAKYLPAFAIEPVVLTVRQDKASYKYIDESLNTQVEGIEVHRTNTREPLKLYSFLKSGTARKGIPHGHVGGRGLVSKLGNFVRSNFYVPDARVGWNRFALREARKIVSAQDVDVVVTTGTPHSTHLVGLELKRQFGIKWLADFRDPWGELYYNKELKRLGFARKKDKRLETTVLETADLVLSVGPSLSQLLASKLDAKSSDRFKYILNGYDAEKMHRLTSQPGDKFTMTFIGLLTVHQPFGAIVESLQRVVQGKTGFAAQSRLVFAGSVEDEIVDQCRLVEGLEVVNRGRVPHDESLQLMMDASLLLNCLPETDEAKLFITGKMMEYLATGNPVLSTGPLDGDAATLLNETTNSKMFGKDDVGGMAAFVEMAFSRWRVGEPFRNDNMDRIKRYSRYETTRELSDCLRRM